MTIINIKRIEIFKLLKKEKTSEMKFNKSATEKILQNNYWNNLKSYHSIDELLQGLIEGEVQAATHDDPILRYVVNNNEAYKDFIFLDPKFNQSFYSIGFSKKKNLNKKEEISKRIFDFTERNNLEAPINKK